jgi:hypothetical protein
MSNTGYLINPKVIQIFTSGPNSGSMVNEEFNTEFDFITDFTSSLICNKLYEYKTYNPLLCPPKPNSICITPILISAFVNDCTAFDYNYNIIFNSNISNPSESIYSIEYSSNTNFSPFTSQEIIISSSNNIITQSINISDLIPLPLNNSSRVRFRIKKICSGMSSSSDSNIITTSCLAAQTNYLIFLEKNSGINQACGCNPNPEVGEISNCLTDENGTIIPQTNPYYINSNEFINATQLYLNNTNVLALAGWYTDSSISRYWNGTSFINIIYC